MAGSDPNAGPFSTTDPAMAHSAHPETVDRPATRSSVAGLVRSLSQEFEESRPPVGLMAATGDVASTMAADQERHRQARSLEGIRRSESGSRPAASSDDATLASPAEHIAHKRTDREHTEPFENGYHFPPKYPWQESTKHGLVSFWKFVITPWGFFWTVYSLNVVAWGGMLFLLLCNAAPAMCTPDCNDIDSPRRKWVEYDSQILTVLFCVTAFGLAPWRFRDLWYLLKYRINGDYSGLRRLAGIHRGWFRLPGSQELAASVGPDNISADVPEKCIPIPAKSIPDAPLTGARAPATPVWKMEFAIWTMVLNTFAQCGLCGIMWGQNRYDRASWTTGFLVGLGCVIAIVGGLVMFFEGKKVKSIEGVPCSERDKERLAQDQEQGLYHYNNIKDKKPKQKVRDPEANPEKK
ncbi:hypothetical protein B0H63DRAFT_481633 [Podospora didyma]|uniref:Alpha-l-rhamnosidase c n=1 Tax=Podospora didyma TaxID=330526 RepID=A0AAE0KE88_9PEZI|nr:hypothetical protein B0H63DRAFT_481633 [Podospora didyma]